VSTLLDAIAHAERLAIVTDLDGTLVPIQPRPELAAPTRTTLDLLTSLAGLPGVTVTAASGRPRDTLAAWFCDEPTISLVAEHGAWQRDDGVWRSVVEADPAAGREIAEALEAVAARVRGAFVERKTWAVALHHRLTPPVCKEALRVAAISLVESFLARHPEFERIDGKELLEVRLRAAHKGSAVEWARRRSGAGTRVLAVGDDVTDEDMFRLLGAGDVSVLVSSEVDQPSVARLRLPTVDAALALLSWVRDSRQGSTRVAAPLVDDREECPTRRFGLLVVSNRLPELRSSRTSDDGSRRKNVGGLVSALTPVLSARRGVWLGWSGRTTADAGGGMRSGVDLEGSPALSWMDFPTAWQERYYNGLCNGALWPVLHSMPTRARIDHRDGVAYREVNAAFAEAAQRLVAPNASVWIHDYHLLLLGRALRERGHRGPIGLFFHVPFCGPELFNVLPWADELLRALLSIDLVGFHTAEYAANFLRCAGALPGVRVEADAAWCDGHRTAVGIFPIGIIPEQFQPRSDAAVSEELDGLLKATAGRRLVLGVDRLDYTKGIPERLMAFGRLLTDVPEWRGRVCLVQVSVPSRADVPEYAQQRARVEQIVGNVNGEFGDADWVPIRYLYRSYGIDVLANLYRAADVGCVTPLRDGMNLVAKEYVAAQDPERPGVLLLSRFAGAAAELDAALLTNPYDVHGMAMDLDRALRMELIERRERHARLLTRVQRTTAMSWAEDFLAALQGAADARSPASPAWAVPS